jgi:CheY-like chemotaxis protein
VTAFANLIHGGKPIEILLVEDNVEEAEWTQQALRDSKVRNKVHWVEDGEQAMSFLRREGPYAAAPRPDLVLLDIYMPRKNGQEVLQEIKDDPALRRIPVVIMTSSDDEREIMRAYERHANCYVTKPIDMDKFLEVVRSIEDFWLTVVRLPAA